MNRQLRSAIVFVLAGMAVLPGCHPRHPLYLHESGDLSTYIEQAQDLRHPDVDAPRLDEVTFAQAPLSLSNPEPTELWDVTLEEAISTTLANSKVIRQLGGAVAIRGGQRTTPDGLVRFPGAADQANTIYQPALQASNTFGLGNNNSIPGLGQISSQGIPQIAQVNSNRAGINGQGVEGALASYDAHFSTNLFWNTTDRPQNIRQQVGNNQFAPFVLQDLNATFQTQLAKRTMEGTEVYLRTHTNYESGNSRGGVQAVPSFWTQDIEVEARHPLLRGSGAQVNRVPIVIARINEDVSLADFEANLRNLVSDVEQAYWDLYASYRDLEAAKGARDSLLVLWRNAYAELVEKRGTIQSEAQAREQYLSFRSQVEETYVVLLTRQRHLRYLMGLTPSDCRLIRPKDEPTTARAQFEWCEAQAEALTRSVELRRHKWRIKQRELELIYYRNQLLPQLDVVGLYRWVGVGDQLITANRRGLDFPTPGSTAFDELTGGAYQEARVGVALSPPQFGARKELSQIRFQQLMLAESHAILEDLELTVLHRLTTAMVNADTEYHLAQTAFNRWVAAQQEVNARTEIVRQGGSTQEQNAFVNLLDSVRRQTDAQREYYQRLVNYSKALADVHLAKGSLLEYDGVCMAEGPWPQKAYWDAVGNARRRDASHYLDYGWSQPKVVAGPPTQQFMHGPGGGPLLESPYGIPTPAGELVPTPAPEGTDQAPTPQPEKLPSPSLEGPADFEGPVELPEFSSAANDAPNDAPRPNVARAVGAQAEGQFDWGDVGLNAPANEDVRQASAEVEVTPSPPSGSAVQWIEPNRPSGKSVPAGNWKSAVR